MNLYTAAERTSPERTIRVVRAGGRTVAQVAADCARTDTVHVEITPKGGVFRNYVPNPIAAELRKALPEVKLLASWRPNEARWWMPTDLGLARTTDWLLRQPSQAILALRRDAWLWSHGWRFVHSSNHFTSYEQMVGLLYGVDGVACPEVHIDFDRKRLEVTSLRLDLNNPEARGAAVGHAVWTVEQGQLDGLILTHNPGLDAAPQWTRFALNAQGQVCRRYYDPVKSWGPEALVPVPIRPDLHGPIGDIHTSLGRYEMGLDALVRELTSRVDVLATNAPTGWRQGDWAGFTAPAKAVLAGEANWVA